MKCNKCGYSDNGSGDWAHACGPVAVQRQPVMNSRIQELAEQASSYAWQMAGNSHHGVSEVSHNQMYEWRMAKFSQLIIEDACRALNPMLRDMISRGQAVELIKQHFGVER